jgi:tetratricopeptide (TPR) repeat protein
VLEILSRARQPSVLVVLGIMGAAGFLPLFGGPGYEHALATGLVVPTVAAIATAWVVASPPREREASVLASVSEGARRGLVLAALSLATALAHAARVGICELWGAVLHFALTAGMGSVLGGVWGALAGEVARASRLRRARALAVVLAVGGPLGGVVVSVWRFLSSPMVFAFDPFVGYFSGTLYDTVIDAGEPLLTYRLATLATSSAVALLASAVARDASRRTGLRLDLRSPGPRARVGLGLGFAAASAMSIFFGTSLGHFSTTASIVRALGREKHGARCDVVYPATTREQDAQLLVKDCDEEVAAVEKVLGGRGPARIRAFFFRDDKEKKRLMGAAHVYIAKPWREEVYLQLGGYPHPVLGHEIAHVVAGSFGRGPFRIAGEANGLLPNPGLIEGIATFASPHDDDLTDAQWARAMKQIGILPPMERVFSLGFLGESSAKSYTLAGAFLGWVAETHGIERVRAWYGGGDLATLVGKDWASLETDYRAWLDTVALPPEASSFARAKFGRPGIFGRKCPHVVDALRQDAEECQATQRYEEAIAKYREALAKDPLDHPSRQGLASTERRYGDRERGRELLLEIASAEKTPRTFRDRAEEALADADFLDGLFGAAAARYAKLAAQSLDEDAARTLEVKAVGASSAPARPAVQALLLGDAKHGPDVFVGGVELGRWGAPRADAPREALVAYLTGRNLVQRGFYAEGAAALDLAVAPLAGDVPLPTARVRREALRQRAIAACALSDQGSLAALNTTVRAPESAFSDASGGRRDALLRMLDRCIR